MKRQLLFSIALFTLLLSFTASSQTATGAKNQTFVAGDNNEFMLNGKPFVVRAAELHYPRIPKEYWEHRIQLCKAMGMNTICIYLFWNYHEQKQDEFNFKGQADAAEFVRLIQKNGMYCIVRPGPYVCAEWEMGGLPWWLLKKKDIQVRTLKDPFFMERAKKFINEAGKQLGSLQIQNGGPIIMVQVENEYGVWGAEQPYMEAIRDAVRAAGFDKVQLFRCDWSSNFDRYQLPGAASTLNFGAGSNINDQFKKFKELNPKAPLMCSEYWTGWFDHWGRPHETRGISTFIGSLKDMLDRRISFSLYMAHGGTSFGQWGGANAPPYSAMVTSYDYNAPIDESGNTTDKFFALRDLLKNYLQEGEKLGDIPPAPTSVIEIPAIAFNERAGLFDNLPKPKKSVDIQPMEQFDQGWGRILYRTMIPPSSIKRKLILTDVHDWATVFLDGTPLRKLDRRRGDNTVEIPQLMVPGRLDILVEATGRVNYGKAIIDPKGITEKVELSDGHDTTNVKNWLVYNLPVDYKFQKEVKYTNKPVNGPAWHKAEFTLDKTGDTFLDVSTWGKGMVWVNGYNIGRFWKIGPQQTMYIPGVWLKKGKNEIIILDVDKPALDIVAGVNKPVLDKIVPDASMLNRAAGQNLDLSGVSPVATGTFGPEKGWKVITFNQVKEGRYFCLEALGSQEANDPYTSVAEIEMTGENGSTLSTLKWKVLYADSEEITAANNSADKVYDTQESTLWHTRYVGEKPKHPHYIVIDMGAVVKVKGVRILPRGDKSNSGVIKDYKFYLETKPFKL